MRNTYEGQPGFFRFLLCAFAPALLLSGVGHAHPAPRSFMHEDLLRYVSHRASSSDPSGGNEDYFRFKAGEGKTLLDYEGGSGVITRFWCTVNSAAPDYLERVRLRCTFDGEATVEAVPMGLFFATGPWRVNDVVSDRVNVMRARPGNADDDSTGRGSFNVYWEMPFSRSARVEVVNDSAESMTLHFNIDYYTGPLREEVPLLFHAEHHAAKPTHASGADFVLAEICGKEGYYAGTVLCVESHPGREGKWYEGDECFVVDGTARGDRLRGTGTEDYFGMAWGVHRTYQAFDHGVTHYQRDLTERDRFYDGRFVLYRWHIADPIVFRNSMKASIEAGHANDCAQCYESVAFWYGRRVQPDPEQ